MYIEKVRDVRDFLGGGDVDGRVVGHAEHTRVRVQVLVQRELEDRGTSITVKISHQISVSCS